jgi:hypothetical protein
VGLDPRDATLGRRNDLLQGVTGQITADLAHQEQPVLAWAWPGGLTPGVVAHGSARGRPLNDDEQEFRCAS